MKSINDMTWKDAAIVEVRSLGARLETIAGQCAADPKRWFSGPVKQSDIESAARQAARLADLIDKIEEKPKRARRRNVKGG